MVSLEATKHVEISVRLLFRRAFIEAPRWTYRLAGSAGGSLPTRAVLLEAVVAAVTGSIWSLAAWITGGQGPADAFWNGVVIGLILCTVWLIYSTIVVLAGRARDRRRRDGDNRPRR